jgi:DNA-directed RNA polymerase subunit H (RpoH/RPB5)
MASTLSESSKSSESKTLTSTSSSSSTSREWVYKEIQAIKVISEMLIDREYKIEYIDLNLTREKNFYVKANKQNSNIIVFINDDEKLNIQGIKDKISVMNREGSNSCIIIYKSNVTSSAKKSLETLEYEFELFALYELQLNITRHRLVPRHSKVLPSEKEHLEKNYKGKLPILLHTDPISRYYAFKRGEYIRITRKDGSIIYRVVK